MGDFWVCALMGKTELLENSGREFPSNKNANLGQFFPLDPQAFHPIHGPRARVCVIRSAMWIYKINK